MCENATQDLTKVKWQDLPPRVRRDFKMKYWIFLAAACCGIVHAEGARVGLEFESEKDNKTGIINHAVTFAPGWEFSEENLINRLELLLEGNRDNRADSDGIRARENKIFVRFGHDGELSENFAYYLRGGLGRSYNNQRSFNFAYVEPGVEYKLSHQWTWTVAFRQIDSIDSADGQHVGKIITGPSFDLNKNNELEFRYVKGNGDKDIKSVVVEYVHKY